MFFIRIEPRFFLVLLALIAAAATAGAEPPPPVSLPITDATPEILIENELAYDAFLLTGQNKLSLYARLSGPPPEPTLTHEKTEYLFKSETAAWTASSGEIENPDNLKTRWVSPNEVGDHSVHVAITRTYTRKDRPGLTEMVFGYKPAEVRLTASAGVVMIIPRSGAEMKDGVLDGHTIGEYPNAANARSAHLKARSALYALPAWYYLVTEQNEKYRITKRFRLGDFDMNFDYMQTGFPQYIPLRMTFVRKLERVIDVLVDEGYPVTRFELISGFRSPHYNFGSMADGADLKRRYSRHMWGDAADLIVDEDRDGVMDDLNQDGKIDCEDARVIFLAAEKVDKQMLDDNDQAFGGRGIYSRHDALEREIQTPYCHIDSRGMLKGDKSFVVWFEGCPPVPPKPKATASNDK